MRSRVHDVLPVPVRRALVRLGADVAIARRRRRLSVAMMTERIGVAKSTYLKLEKGDPSVSLGVLAMALYALGLGDELGNIVSPSRDVQGTLLESERLPKRIRARKVPTAS